MLDLRRNEFSSTIVGFTSTKELLFNKLHPYIEGTNKEKSEEEV
tara:strand:- start:178 stop:309 length:132 start_codon:yes stop_codon:yes gene_type:complete